MLLSFYLFIEVDARSLDLLTVGDSRIAITADIVSRAVFRIFFRASMPRTVGKNLSSVNAHALVKERTVS